MPVELPHSVADVLDETATFEPAALLAVRKLARAKPWQGTDAERLAKFNTCAVELATVYGFEPWTIAIGDAAAVDGEARRFVVTKLSVVTFLHFIAARRGMQPFGCFRWSINLFRRCFPRSFAACDQRGPFLVRAE